MDDGRRDTGNRETGDGRQNRETGDWRLETGDWRLETVFLCATAPLRENIFSVFALLQIASINGIMRAKGDQKDFFLRFMPFKSKNYSTIAAT